MMIADPLIHRWTMDEYYRKADMGMFDDCHVELIEGVVIEMSPMNSAHRTSVVLSSEALRRGFLQGYFVCTQCPIRLLDASEPEPDVAVIPGAARDYANAHPATAVRIVEVAETSLERDRTIKAGLYASVGIADYWIVNLVDKQLEVHRRPVADGSHPSGHRYDEVTTLKPGDTVSPLAAPQATITVAELLP